MCFYLFVAVSLRNLQIYKIFLYMMANILI